LLRSVFALALAATFHGHARADTTVAATAALDGGARPRVIVTAIEDIILDHVNFARGQAALRPESRTVLDQLAALLRREHPPIEALAVEGHADDREPETLAQRRAEAVRDYLVKQGVAAARLTPRSAGASKPLDARHAEAARAKNRRVEFVILKRAS
jgi:outer membrane protein OmpA-like peptidoglycan-associated protein